MKNIKYIIMIFIVIKSYSQIQITNTISLRTNTPAKNHFGSYLKDIYGDFNPYIGTWVWQSGDKKVTFEFKKITQHYIQKCNCYSDLLVADYSYTTNNNLTTIVDSSLISQNSTNPDDYQMLTIDAKTNSISFTFKDIGIEKNQVGFPKALFTRVVGTTNQLTLNLKNPEGSQLTFPDSPQPNANFSIPNYIILTKQ